ncbi:hypothetical protein HPB49_016272 [Dermacentor silvarum]|uniref:Uncharacterized protein n=1 Tax=Dermacentor silvarum TaxID=543639 RepID=A0ACB8C4E2_DERSI|nr:hypothetical protein HPB49_016272 [Dermacentor silvarum]
MSFEVRPSRPRALQCLQCRRYGPATAACQRPARCPSCGGSHETGYSCVTKHKCMHCGGKHPANSQGASCGRGSGTSQP